jgi:hypothetical protein
LSVWGADFFTLVFFSGDVVAAALLTGVDFLLDRPNRAATADAAFVIDSIPVQSMLLSPAFLSALLLAEQDRADNAFFFVDGPTIRSRLCRSASEYLPTTVFLLSFILLDSLKGGVVWL